MFSATRLLSTSPTSLHQHPKDVAGSSMFVSIGLLGISPQPVYEVPESESQTTVPIGMIYIRTLLFRCSNNVKHIHHLSPSLVPAYLEHMGSPLDLATTTLTQHHLPDCSHQVLSKLCCTSIAIILTFSFGPDFPPVSEALGLPSFLPLHSESSSTVLRIPRSTLRATTYDGQTIYLRRKSKVISTTTDVSFTEILTKEEFIS